MGRDTATLYSQQLLLTTVLGADDAQARGRGPAGGLIDVEWLRRSEREPNDSAWALQGLYAFSRTLSVQGRYSSLRESLTTSATSMVVDYHPFIERGSTVNVRIGGTAHAGFLYSSTASADLLQVEPITAGVLDFGGGGWASARRQVGPVLLGGGALFQATQAVSAAGRRGQFPPCVRQLDERSWHGLRPDAWGDGTGRRLGGGVGHRQVLRNAGARVVDPSVGGSPVHGRGDVRPRPRSIPRHRL